jgi:hypothetical protein
MTLIAGYVLIVLLAIYAWHRLVSHNKKSGSLDLQLEIEMLRKARIMFPEASSDIVALDAFYQHTFRSMLIAQKEGNRAWIELKRQSIAIYNAKNRAIIEAVRFEETYISPFSHEAAHPIIPFQRS